MGVSKIHLLFDSFSKKERKELAYLIKSSFFYLKNEDYAIFDVLANTGFDQEVDFRKRIFEKVFNGKEYEDQLLRSSFSRLYKAFEKYAVLLELKASENEEINQIALSRYFRKHNLKKLFVHNNKQNKPIKGSTISLEIQLQMEFENYQFDSLEKRNQELNIQNLLDLTDRNFYSKKLRFACYAMSHEAIYSKKYDLRNIEYIINQIEKEQLQKEALIGVYYHAYLMLTDPDNDEYYKNYKQHLFDHQSVFPLEEKRSLYFFALNKCIKKLNSGFPEYGREGLVIYQEAIKNKTLLINGSLSRFTYRNVAMMAIRINDFDLAEELTDAYEALLRKQDRESAFNFNKALIHYYRKSYAEALNHITSADFKDHLINLAAKTLQAKIYFEMDEGQLLEYHLDSMEMYIIRNKVLGYHRKNYKNFIRYTKKLAKRKLFDPLAKAKLKERIKTEEVLTEKKWLVEQLTM